MGPVEYTYNITTNDPGYPVISLALVATVKPLPEFIRRLDNPAIATGEIVDTFKVWPTAHARMVLERGERVSVRFRIWPGQYRPKQEDLSPTINVDGATGGSRGGPLVQSGAPAQSSMPQPAPSLDKVKVRVTREVGRPIYWLDLDIGPINEAGAYNWRWTPQADYKELADLPLELDVTVLGEAVVTTPSWTGPVEVSLSGGRGAETLVGRIGVRKLAGSFHVNAASSTLPFLIVEPRALIDGQNYLITVTAKLVEGLQPGTREGVVRIDTDDASRPRIEVPCKIRLVP
jgi:hypothetical protein